MSLETKVRAEAARRCFHYLDPYWSPDAGGADGGMVDPMRDPEMRQNIRSFVQCMIELAREQDVLNSDSHEGNEDG